MNPHLNPLPEEVLHKNCLAVCICPSTSSRRAVNCICVRGSTGSPRTRIATSGAKPPQREEVRCSAQIRRIVSNCRPDRQYPAVKRDRTNYAYCEKFIEVCWHPCLDKMAMERKSRRDALQASLFASTLGIVPNFTNIHIAWPVYACYIEWSLEGSHSGLVRAPAKRLGGEIPLMGSNPIPSAPPVKNPTLSSLPISSH